MSLSTHVLDTVARAAGGGRRDRAAPRRRGGRVGRRPTTTAARRSATSAPGEYELVFADRRLLRRARRSSTASRSASGSPTRRALPRAAARLALGLQHVSRLLSRAFALSGNGVVAQVCAGGHRPARDGAGRVARCRRPSPLPPGPAKRHRVPGLPSRRGASRLTTRRRSPREPGPEPAHPKPAATARTVAAGVLFAALALVTAAVAWPSSSRCGRCSPPTSASRSVARSLVLFAVGFGVAYAAALTSDHPGGAPVDAVFAIAASIAWPLSGHALLGGIARVRRRRPARVPRPPRPGQCPRRRHGRHRVDRHRDRRDDRRRRDRTHKQARRPARRSPRATPTKTCPSGACSAPSTTPPRRPPART